LLPVVVSASMSGVKSASPTFVLVVA